MDTKVRIESLNDSVNGINDLHVKIHCYYELTKYEADFKKIAKHRQKQQKLLKYFEQK